ncbi:hypothetical protein [Reyranella sp. CPCC 100927]|uniref:hypothetical protein n=1 Tax=Reyranella sp. CPCC 100927 TaxID=2599616 RepID=UPI0011B6130D|nr:hypothetical protein [Reyranella sp. CPCC 100927]TWT13609.1 hypothetical protein FQU96_06715 [Reyranella sp. CPCC 100927]
MTIDRQSEHVRDGLRRQSEAFWDFQDRLLDHMERMNHTWFRRRHEGTHAALKAACSMWTSATPADAMQVYLGWANGSIERLTRDALDVQMHGNIFANLILGATHQVMGGPSEAGQADIMTPTEADPPVTLRNAA